MSRHRNWHVHTHLAVAWCLTCEKCCLLCINAHSSCMILFVKFSLYDSIVHLYIMLLFIFTPSYYSFPGFLPSFICFDVQMVCSNPKHFQQDSMPDVKNRTCPASISSMNFRAAAPLRVNTAVPLPNGFLPIFQIE